MFQLTTLSWDPPSDHPSEQIFGRYFGISGINYASENITQLLLAVVTLFLIGIPWVFIVKMVLAIPTAIFNFLIDPEPANGRTKEEAKLVVVSVACH